MKLTKLKIEKFKRVKEIEIPLSDVNILVGTNGCGKSSIIQAVHLACCVMRQVDRVDGSRTSTVGVEELDYLPTDDYKTLGHNGNWGNQEGSPSSAVTLTFTKPDDSTVVGRCRLRSARNAGISITGSVPSDLTPLLRTKRKFFSAYIPGISGIPNKEERKSKKIILKACSFGDSNVILRNALLLLKEINPANIGLIQQWIQRIIGPITIDVKHDNETDLYIECNITTNGTTKSIELIGTGYLQLIQIFCYILLFDPGVLLIDEPDIHLHPQVQEKLIGVLSDVARARGIKIIITTHSPFIVRGAPVDTNIYWLQNGSIESANRSLVETALGWGAFGKRLIIISEDSNTSLLKKIVSQWPEIEQAVAFYPGNGYKNIPSPQQAKELSETLGGKFKILVHRDRDSLTDAEIATLSANYTNSGVHLWLPKESDIEGYFCQPTFLEVFLGCSLLQAETYISEITTQHATTVREQFNKQRTAHNEEIHKSGGSPTSESVWIDFQQRPLKGAKGKFLFGQLKNKAPSKAFSEEKINLASLSGVVALDLKHCIEQILSQ